MSAANIAASLSAALVTTLSRALDPNTRREMVAPRHSAAGSATSSGAFAWASSLRPYDEALLRRAFDVARAPACGGATIHSARRSPTAREAPDGAGQRIHQRGRRTAPPTPSGCSLRAPPALTTSRSLRAARLYTSAEPCATRVCATYWAGDRGRRLRPDREGRSKSRPRAPGEPDARSVLRHCVRRRPASDGGRRAAARGRGG